MCLTIHLEKLENVDEEKGYEIFKTSAEHVTKWKEKMNGAENIKLRYYFREEPFDKVPFFVSL